MSDLLAEALARFEQLMERVDRLDLYEPRAAALATADREGRPSSRTVLLKDWGERGFVFYTNLESRKSRQIRENPRAALTFFWQGLMEQVQVEGSVEPVSSAEADAYWATRPRESQLGAWASRQSSTLESPEALQAAYEVCVNRFDGQDIARPDFWSGFRLVPDRIEFWVSKPFRLHERRLYEQTNGGWTVRWLFP